MRFALILIDIARRYEEVERCLISELGLMREALKAIPTSGAKSTRRIIQAIEYFGK